jgi:hypothetical protein
MADAPDPITSPPSMVPGGYDATSDADVGGWVKVSANMPGGSEDLWRGEMPDSPPWRQT